MKRINLTLEEIADMALISVDDLLEIAEREPKVAALIAESPHGTPDSGIPPDPSMYGKLRKFLQEDDDDFDDLDFDDQDDDLYEDFEDD
jgi:hypothetical protein